MKTQIAFLIGLLFVTSFSVSAQGGGYAKRNEGHSKGEKLEKLKAELSLTDEQVTQWKEIRQRYKPQLKAIRQDQSLNEQEKKEKGKALRQQKDEELKALLTDEQFTKFKELKRQNRKDKKLRMRG